MKKEKRRDERKAETQLRGGEMVGGVVGGGEAGSAFSTESLHTQGGGLANRSYRSRVGGGSNQGMLVHLTILAAEDEESDAVLLRIAHKAAGLPNPLVVVGDGQCAVDYLRGEPPYDDRVRFPLPGILLLDLKMPRMDGFEVLAWLGRSREFSALPVVVLSGSPRESDVARALELGAWEYLMKPFDGRELAGMLRDMRQKWLAPEIWKWA